MYLISCIVQIEVFSSTHIHVFSKWYSCVQIRTVVRFKVEGVEVLDVVGIVRNVHLDGKGVRYELQLR